MPSLTRSTFAAACKCGALGPLGPNGHNRAKKGGNGGKGNSLPWTTMRLFGCSWRKRGTEKTCEINELGVRNGNGLQWAHLGPPWDLVAPVCPFGSCWGGFPLGSGGLLGDRSLGLSPFRTFGTLGALGLKGLGPKLGFHGGPRGLRGKP